MTSDFNKISIKVCCIKKSLHKKCKKEKNTLHLLQAVWANHYLIHNCCMLELTPVGSFLCM